MCRHSTWLLASLMFGLMLFVTGCDESNKNKPGASSSPPVVNSANPGAAGPTLGEIKPALVEVQLYYPDNTGEWVVPVKAKVDEKDKYKAAVAALIEGTKEPGLTGIFPKGVKVNYVKVQDGLAIVDFSDELIDKFIGGSTGEEMLVGSLVNTLTEFPEISSVQITVSGHEIETIAGHLDTGKPFARQIELLK